MKKEIEIKATWDEANKVWYATSEDVTGLHVCCPTLEEVFEVVDDVLPDLVAHNLGVHKMDAVPYHIMHSRVAHVHN